MTAVPVPVESGSSDVPEKWAAIDAAVPMMATTMLAYLAQIAVSMRRGRTNQTWEPSHTGILFRSRRDHHQQSLVGHPASTKDLEDYPHILTYALATRSSPNSMETSGPDETGPSAASDARR